MTRPLYPDVSIFDLRHFRLVYRSAWGAPAGLRDKARRELTEFVGPHGVRQHDALGPVAQRWVLPTYGSRKATALDFFGDRPRTQLGGGYVIH